jgi:hypothetical protein
MPPKQPPRPPAARPRPLKAPRDPHRTKLLDKDAWGYNFAQPIWKLDAGAERMKRAPEDRERERVLTMLRREYELDPKQLSAGLDGEVIPWGLFREDARTDKVRNEKASLRRAFAEAVRAACLKSRGGVLGVAQTHFLAHKLGLMQTIRCKADAQAFPLTLELQNVVMLEKYEASYVLHIDRVFYPVFALPKASRFAEPAVLADAYRLLDGRGESVVRSPKKEPLVVVSGDPHKDPTARFRWQVVAGDHALTLEEPIGRAPTFTAKDASGAVLLSCDNSLATEARGLDVTLRVDFAADIKPWLGFLAVYLDAFTQRTQGILGRAREVADQKAKAEAEAVEHKG